MLPAKTQFSMWARNENVSVLHSAKNKIHSSSFHHSNTYTVMVEWTRHKIAEQRPHHSTLPCQTTQEAEEMEIEWWSVFFFALIDVFILLKYENACFACYSFVVFRESSRVMCVVMRVFITVAVRTAISIFYIQFTIVKWFEFPSAWHARSQLTIA